MPLGFIPPEHPSSLSIRPALGHALKLRPRPRPRRCGGTACCELPRGAGCRDGPAARSGGEPVAGGFGSRPRAEGGRVGATLSPGSLRASYSSRVPRRELEGLLLRMVDFGESDRIVHLLTPESGRLTAMAKGARRSVKRFPGTLDLFNHLRVQLFRSRPGRMEYLQQAKLLSPQLALREKPARFALACFVLELLDRMAPEGGAPADCRKLYDFAKDETG